MEVIGVRREIYIGKQVEGHNCDFKYIDAELTKYIICCTMNSKNDYKTKFEIDLWTEYGECMSGWTTSSQGRIEVRFVDNFKGFTFKPINNLLINDSKLEEKIKELIKNNDNSEKCRNCYGDVYFSIFSELSFDNNVFIVSYDGGDPYYPSGDYHVNMELFTSSVRTKSQRQVWIFVGKSNTGKSYLASSIKSLSVYETDSSPTLPDSITESIIVVGNKYKFDINDIKKKIFGKPEIHIVKFD
jgi:hypothetical protein